MRMTLEVQGEFPCCPAKGFIKCCWFEPDEGQRRLTRARPSRDYYLLVSPTGSFFKAVLRPFVTNISLVN